MSRELKSTAVELLGEGAAPQAVGIRSLRLAGKLRDSPCKLLRL